MDAIHIEIPTIFFEERSISDEDWAKTPESVRRGFEWLWKEQERLRAQTEQSSRNSSLPSSTDRPQHQRPARTVSTGRRPGGQPGHVGVTRPLVPEILLSAPPVHVRPTVCPCGHPIPPDAELTGAPYRLQHWELPLIAPQVTETRLDHCTCEHCGRVVRAALPVGMPALTLGPHVQALVTLLTGQYHLSKQSVSTLMRSVFGMPISVASVIAVEQAASAALEAPVAAVIVQAQAAPIKHLDESGWRQQRELDPGTPDGTPLKKSWIWSMTTADATIYLIRRSRAASVAHELLGFDYTVPLTLQMVVITDRHGAYNWLPLWARQICWALLDRDFVAISERSNPVARRIGLALLAQADLLWAAWHAHRQGHMTFAELGTALTPVRAQVAQLLREGHDADKRTQTTCHNLRTLEPALWTFLRVEGVEPTNNIGERSQRRGVVKRERTGGTQTSAGSRFVERILSTAATCRQQGKNPLTYLTEAIIAYQYGRDAPALIGP